jgi:hypothetical protein
MTVRAIRIATYPSVPTACPVLYAASPTGAMKAANAGKCVTSHSSLWLFFVDRAHYDAPDEVWTVKALEPSARGGRLL